jgi:ribosomal protein L31
VYKLSLLYEFAGVFLPNSNEIKKQQYIMAKSNTKSSFYPNATAKCTNCGSIYNYGSSIETLSIEICGNCHPFYTGKAVLLDTAGRIDKFQSRMTKIVTDVKVAKTKTRKSVQSLSDLIKEDEVAEEVKAPKVKYVKPVVAEAVVTEVVTETVEVKNVDTEADSTSTPVDLTIVEGIGPKIAELLISKGIATFAQLADAPIADIQAILDENSLGGHKADTWAQQSALARDGKMEELETLKKELDGGKVA